MCKTGKYLYNSAGMVCSGQEGVPFPPKEWLEYVVLLYSLRSRSQGFKSSHMTSGILVESINYWLLHKT